MARRNLPRFNAPASQRGAVLYVALIMLLLLALIGIVGMQVTGMQERMASNYFAVNQAFQGAENEARRVECSLEAMVNRSAVAGCPAVVVDQICDSGFDASQWAGARERTDGAATSARLIGPCISGNTSLAMGSEPISEDPNPIFQITAYSTNDAATADAAIDTIFRP